MTDVRSSHRYLGTRSTQQAPYLDGDGERALLEAARRGSGEAAYALVESHMRLVQSVARRYAHGGLDLEDLVGEGVVGLMQAIQRYDLDRDVRFAAYAVWWVRAFIHKYCTDNRRMVPGPSTRNGRRLMLNLRKTQRELMQARGRVPSFEELAEELGVTAEEVAHVESVLSGRDVRIGNEGDGRPSIELPAPVESPEEEAAEREERELAAERLEEAMKSLSAREREVISRRLVDEDPTTLAVLGESLGVSRERVRQIQEGARKKLRKSLASMGAVA